VKHDPLSPPLRRDLRAIFIEGVLFSVMVGAGESYVSAFALALGMGEVASGLVATIPLLAGGILQLLTPWGVRQVGSPRRWTSVGAFLQGLAFVPLAIGAFAGGMAGALVFGAATLYWAAGLAIGPSWNVWVEKLVPSSLRVRYFARRNSGAQAGLLAGLLLGGFVLQLAADRDFVLAGFGSIFALAAVCRLASIRYFLQQTDVPPGAFAVKGFPALELVRHPPRGPGARLLAYMLMLMASVMIAGPFFSAYMLRELELPYWSYMTITATSLGAKVLVLPFLGRFARRFGLAALIRLSWLGIAPMAALWLVSRRTEYLIALQIVSGVAWAAHEYATFLLLFDTVRSEHRTAVLTAYNLANAVVHVSGSLLGGWIFERVGGGVPGYQAIFLASSVTRIACVGLLLRVPEGRVPATRPMFRFMGVGPAMGAMLRPILATIRFRGRSPRAGRPDAGE
jgi:MFS family permease